MKTLVIPLTPEQAFDLFTQGMATWWPLATHSIGKTTATDVRLEGAVGGRIVEYGVQGADTHGVQEPTGYWGTVSDWDPPNSLSFTWHPGSDPKQHGQVTVNFKPVEDGTEVQVTHDPGDGWDLMLDFYARHSR